MPVVLISILALFIVLTAVMVVRTKRRRGQRSGELAELASSLGLEHIDKADSAFRDAWAELPGIPKAGECRHVMYGSLGGLAVTAFRHRYVVSTGQSTQVIHHWVFSTDVPEWPATHLRPRAGIARMLGVRSRVSSDELFDRAWVIKTDDPAFADTLLGPAVRELLREQLGGERWVRARRWHVFRGKLCMVTRRDLSAGQVRAGFDALEAMMRAIAREPALDAGA